MHSGQSLVGTLRSFAAIPPYAPRPLIERVTDRSLPAGVLYPRNHVGGRKLPVLVDIYGGPGHQEVVAQRARWLEKQWFADAGFAVVTIDNRGTPGVAPSFEKVIDRGAWDSIPLKLFGCVLLIGGLWPFLNPVEKSAMKQLGRHLPMSKSVSG